MARWTTVVAAGVLVVGVLAGCATLPGGAEARDVYELNIVRQVALACHNFAMAHGGELPSHTSELIPYLDGGFDLVQIELVTTGKLSEIADPANTVLLRSKTVSKTGTRAVAFVDGHCERVTEE